MRRHSPEVRKRRRLPFSCIALPSGLLILTLVSPLLADLQESGYRFEAVYTGELLRNVSGGLQYGSAYLDNLDLILEVDLPHGSGGESGTLFLYGLYNNRGTFADRYTGDIQVTSNIDAPEAWRLFEAWYEFDSDSWSIRGGLYDLNSEFDVNETGGLFLNSSHGIGAELSQTGENGPGIFPVSSLALRLQWQHREIVTRIAVLDGVPGNPQNPSSNSIELDNDEGMLLVAEVDLPLGEGGRAWGGYWHYSADFERPFAAGRRYGNDGWYIGAELGIDLYGRNAAAFIRLGRADEHLNAIGNYVGAGIVIEAPFPTRSEDRLGIAVASAGAGDPYRLSIAQQGSKSARRETTWELTYRASLSEHLVVQPDVQYLQNPGADAGIGNALVVGLRFELSF